MPHSFEGNRVVADTGCRYPIFNAAVVGFSRGQLSGAVSAAGGMGLMATNTPDLASLAREYDQARLMSDNPLGLQMFLRMLKGRVDEVLDWVLEDRTRLLVTCVGDPAPIAVRAHEAGVKHYHQVGSLRDAVRAADAGVDGLIVEGAESGGLRSVRSPHLFTLLQQVRAAVDLPLIAAGGIVDGHSMAGAFALGAEGILMGTRFFSSTESPVHLNWKQAIVDSAVTHNIVTGPPGVRMRVADTALAGAAIRGEIDTSKNPYGGPFQEGFDNGRMDITLVGCGESAVLIDEIKPVSQIVDETVRVFWEQVDRIAALRG